MNHLSDFAKNFTVAPLPPWPGYRLHKSFQGSLEKNILDVVNIIETSVDNTYEYDKKQTWNSKKEEKDWKEWSNQVLSKARTMARRFYVRVTCLRFFECCMVSFFFF